MSQEIEPTAAEARAIAEAARARSELEATESAFDTIRQEILDQIAATKLGESELRELLYMSVSALDAVRQRLRMLVANGDMARNSLSMRELLGDLQE